MHTVQQAIQAGTAALRDGVGKVRPCRANAAVWSQELVVTRLVAPAPDLEQRALSARARVLRDQRVVAHSEAGSDRSPEAGAATGRTFLPVYAVLPASHGSRPT